MISRLSIRARLTIAFAAALLFVLALAAAFVYVRVDETLTSGLDDTLEAQVGELSALAAEGGDPESGLPGPADVEDGFSQILSADGEVLASSLPGESSVLDPEELRRAASGSLTEERPVAGVDGEARMAAAPADGPEGDVVVVAGVSTDDRAEALAGISGAFAIGAPLALLIASGLGYLLAARSLAPVEAMRRRAGEITLHRSGERLPLPASDDEIRRLGETLNTMLERIEASLERERVFVADAAHELRTPLANLRTELELAERPGREPEEMRAALRSAAVETLRLTRLAEDLLVLARSDDGRLPIRREAVEVAPMLETVAARFEPDAREAGRELSVDCAAGLGGMLDRMRMEQALGNLVDNALRHGGGEIGIAAVAVDGALAFTVSDEGAGFEHGFGDRAFERFTRADDGRTGGGSGLGLAIVRAIAEAHGGTAAIESDAGRTTVRIAIPPA